MGLLMVLWLAFAGMVGAQECYGLAFCGEFKETCFCLNGRKCERGDSCGGEEKCTDCSLLPDNVVGASCFLSRRNVCTFNCPPNTDYLYGGCGISVIGKSGECFLSSSAAGCIGWCPEGTVCRVKKSEPWKCPCGKKAQGLTCPEGTYPSCGWSCKKNCKNKGDGSCTAAQRQFERQFGCGLLRYGGYFKRILPAVSIPSSFRAKAL